MIAIVFGSGLIVTTVGMLSLMARSIHHRRLEVELKRDLLDRGMSRRRGCPSGGGVVRPTVDVFNRSATRGEMR